MCPKIKIKYTIYIYGHQRHNDSKCIYICICNKPSFLDYIVANLISDSIKDKKTLIVVSGV